jgi:hypothetical protein
MKAYLEDLRKKIFQAEDRGMPKSARPLVLSGLAAPP